MIWVQKFLTNVHLNFFATRGIILRKHFKVVEWRLFSSEVRIFHVAFGWKGGFYGPPSLPIFFHFPSSGCDHFSYLKPINRVGSIRPYYTLDR